MTIPSNPENFNSAGKKPPDCESPIAPLIGDFALALILLKPEMGAPVVALVKSVSTLSGESGSMPGRHQFQQVI